MHTALRGPLTDLRAIGRARTVLVHVTGDCDLAVQDVDGAIALLRRELPETCKMTVTAAPDPWLVGSAQVVVIAVMDERAFGGSADRARAAEDGRLGVTGAMRAWGEAPVRALALAVG